MLDLPYQLISNDLPYQFDNQTATSENPLGMTYNKYGIQVQSAMAANNYLNRHSKDAREMMDIALRKPEVVKDTSEWRIIDPSKTDLVNKSLGLKGKNRIPSNWFGVVYANDSSLAKSIVDSDEFDIFYKKHVFPNSHIFNFASNDNLHYSLGHATLMNPYIDSDGNFRAFVFDKYDYDILTLFDDDNKLKPKKKCKTVILNNLAYLLQQDRIIENYYVLVPIKYKKQK